MTEKNIKNKIENQEINLKEEKKELKKKTEKMFIELGACFFIGVSISYPFSEILENFNIYIYAMSLIELGVLTVNISKIVGLNKEIKESKKELESLKIELDRQKEKIKRKENIEKNYKNNNLYVRVYPYSQKEKSKTLILKK